MRDFGAAACIKNVCNVKNGAKRGLSPKCTTISQTVDQIKIEPKARSSEESSTVHPVNAKGSTDSISKDKGTVNSKDMRDVFAKIPQKGDSPQIGENVAESIANNSKIDRRGYEIKDIKIKPMSSNGLSASAASPQAVNIGSVKSVAELFAFVKQNDSRFNPNPANPYLLNPDGTPIELYHQTAEDITVFDERHEGAGTSDGETPFGIYLKPTADDIGLKGKKQMALYARITNPLTAQNRTELVNKVKAISTEYAELYSKRKSLDDEYKRKVDDAGKAVSDYMKEWRGKNPDASRTSIYDDVKYNELSDIEDNLIEEWEKEGTKIDRKMKGAKRGLSPKCTTISQTVDHCR